MQKNIIQYWIKYDTKKAVGDGIYFFDLGIEFTRITPVKKIWIRSLDRAKIIDYRFNEVNKTTRRRNNNKRKRYPNNNQENYLKEVNATTLSELGGDGSTTTSGTLWIWLDGILVESEYSRTINTDTHTNYDTVQVTDVVDSDSEIDKQADLNSANFQ